MGQGIFTAVFSGGAVVGLIFGSSIVEYFSWHMTFLSIVPLLISLQVIAYKKIRIRSERLVPVSHSNLEIKGTVYLVILVSTFLFGLTLLPNSISAVNLLIRVTTTVLFSVSVVFVALFTRSQQKAKNPIVDVGIIKNLVLLGSVNLSVYHSLVMVIDKQINQFFTCFSLQLFSPKGK